MGSKNMRMATQVSGAPDKPFSWELGFTDYVASHLVVSVAA